jgi:hypothetical protein
MPDFSDPLWDEIDEATLVALVRMGCERCGSQAAWAEQHGLSPSYVSDYLGGRRAAAEKIAAVFGYVPVRKFVKTRTP